MKTVLHGPCNTTLILDPQQIFPTDPGMGTPAMVEYRGGTATYWCAINEGEVVSINGAIPLPNVVMNWLEEQWSRIEEFLVTKVYLK